MQQFSDLNKTLMRLTNKQLVFFGDIFIGTNKTKEANKGFTIKLPVTVNDLSNAQQRVAVARALINKPSVIFADEPSGNLDSESAKALHELFFELRKTMNQTFVIVTHNEVLANMADRKLTMRDGKIS